VTTQSGSFLATGRGRLTLLLLCAVQFLDIADSSIMNVALPSIRRDLGFSVQGLQWIRSGYLVTHGGLLLLGGRAGDLLGRQRLLVAGTTLLAACSLAGGLAADAGMLVGARPGQGAGAALMAPAGLSLLTTTFNRGTDRNRALSVWVAVSGLAAAAGVFLGGVLSQGPGHGEPPATPPTFASRTWAGRGCRRCQTRHLSCEAVARNDSGRLA
jgi:MFS family permease